MIRNLAILHSLFAALTLIAGPVALHSIDMEWEEQVCAGLTIDLGQSTDYCGITFPYTLDAGPGFDSYLWSTGETTQSIVINDYGTYSVTGFATGCPPVTDEVAIVGFPDPPPLDFVGTYPDCDDLFPVTLDAGPGFDSYLWSTGETTQTIQLDEPTSVTVDLANVCASGQYIYDLWVWITPPSIVFPADMSFCSNQFPITLSAAGPFDTYQWNTGSTDPAITVTGPGLYSVEVENSCGTASDDIEFFLLGDPFPLDLGPDLTVCSADFPFTLDAGPGADSYSWSTGESTQTLNITGPGYYSVTATDQCGPVSDGIYINEATGAPSPNLGSDLDLCSTAFPYTLNAGPGSSYLWSTGASTQTISITGPGTYDVTVNSSCGSGSDAITITETTSAPTPDLGPDLSLCPADYPVTLDAGPVGPYAWNTGETTQTITVTGPGYYSVNVSNGCGTVNEAILISEAAPGANPDLGPDLALCPGDFPYTLDAGPGDSHVWSTGETSQSISISGPGTYDVTVTSTCGTATDEVIVTAASGPPSVDLGPNVQLCSSDFPYTIDAGPAGNFSWSTGETTQTIDVAGPGYYYVTVGNSCGSASDGLHVSQTAPLSPPDLGQDEDLCDFQFPVWLSAGGGAATYSWSTGETTQSISASGPGTYTVTKTNGCETLTDEVVLNEVVCDPCDFILDDHGLSVFGDGGGTGNLLYLNGLDTIDVGGFDDFYACSGAEVFWGNGGGFHDLWLEEGANVELDGTSGFFSVYAMNNNTVTVTSASGFSDFYISSGSTLILNDWGSVFNFYLECGATLIFDNPGFSPSAQIYAECPDVDIIDIQGGFNVEDVTCCANVQQTLAANQIPGPIVDIGGFIDENTITYPYTLDASSVTGPYTWSTGQTTASIQVNGPGTYTVSVPSTCGTAVGTAIIEPLPEPPTTVDLGPDLEVCPADYPITLDAGDGVEFLWSNNQTTQTIQINGPGTYSVEVFQFCSSATGSITVTSSDGIPDPDLGPDEAICPSSFPYTLDAGLGDSYSWSTGENSQTIDVSAPGTYEVTVTNSCGTGTDDITLTTLPAPTGLDLGPDQALCPDQFPGDIDAGPADSYLWSTGETTQIIEVTAAGTYAVEVTSTCGTSTDEITFTDRDCGPCDYVIDPASWGAFGNGSGSYTTLTGSNDPFNIGGVGDFYVCSGADVNVSQSGYHDFWLGEGATWDITLGSGGWNVFALNGNIVDVNTTGNSNYYIGAGSTINVYANQGTNATYYLECGAQMTVDAASFSGTIIAECADADIIDLQGAVLPSQVTCCTVDYALPLGVDVGSILDLGGFIDESSITYPYTLDASSVSGPYLWSTGETTASIQVNGPGTYTCSVPNEICGTSLGTAIIGSYEAISLNPDLGPDMDLCPSDLPITLDAGPNGVTYAWSTGETTQTITVTEPGIYSVTVNGYCSSASDQVQINVDEDVSTIDLGPDIELCDSDFPVALDAGPGYDSYTWSTGETTQSIAVNSAQTITIDVTNGCGTASDQVVITSLGTAPDVDFGASMNTCPADFPVTLNAGTGYNYEWSTGETSSSIAVNAPGTYNVIISNACGSAVESFVINEAFPSPVPDLGADMDLCPSDYPITLDAGEGESYLWSTGETTQTISVSSAGTYDVTVTNSCGSATDAIVITSLTAAPSFDLGADQAICPADLPLTLNATSGDFIYWSTGESSPAISVNDVGDYHVTVSNSCGTFYDEITLTWDGQIAAPDLGADLAVCPSDYPITLDAGPGDSYVWSTGETTQTIQVNAAGNYDVTVTGTCNTASDDITITETTAGPTPDLGIDATLCSSDYPYTLNAGPGDNYVWSTGESTQTIQVNAAGTYEVTVSNTCGTGSDEIILTDGPSAPTPDLGADFSVCPTDYPITLDAGAGDSWAWSTGETTQTILVNTAGTYDVTVTNSCGTGSSDVIITENASGPTPDLGADFSVCPSDYPITLDAGAGDSWTWSTGQTTQTITINAAGTYDVTVTNSCGTGSSDVVITENASGPTPDLGADFSVCPTDYPITLDAGAGDSWAWSTGEATQTIQVNAAGTYDVTVTNSCGTGFSDIVITNNPNSPSPALGADISACASDYPITLDAGDGDSWLWSSGEMTQTIQVNMAGTYDVTVTGICGTGTDEITITDSDGPSPDLGPDLDLCGPDFPMTLDAGLGDSYSWNTGEVTQTILVNGPGNYAVTVSNSCGTATDALIITQTDLGPEPDLGPDLALCASDFPITLDAGPGDTYLWSTGETTQTISIATPGDYEVTLTDYCGSGTDAISIVITTDGPSPDLGPDQDLCPNEFPITLNAGPGDVYIWSTGETAQSIMINGPGTYEVTVTSGCGTGSDLVVINETGMAPNPDLGADMSVCSQDFPITLDAGPGDSYFWSTGETSQTIQVNSAGNYEVTVTNDCGTGSTDLAISLSPAAPEPDLGADLLVCPNEFPITLDGGTGDSWVWSTGETTQTIQVNASGSYDVNVSNSCGTGYSDIVIAENAGSPAPDLGEDMDLCPDDFPITLDAGAGDDYLWNNGGTTQTFDVSAPGDYSVTVSNTCGSGSSSISITESTGAPQPDLGADMSICAWEFPVTLDAGDGESYLWNNGGTTQTFDAMESGDYEVTVTNACGVATSSITIAENPPAPSPDLGADITLCASDLPVLLDAGEADDYLWNNGGTTQTFSVTQPGTYSVTASNSCGSGTSQMSIAFVTAPELDMGPDIIVCEDELPVRFYNTTSEENYWWWNGSDADTAYVSSSGWYWMETDYVCGSVRDSAQVSVLEGESSIQEEFICEGDTFYFQDLVLTTPGFYPSLVENGASNGCDLDLMIDLSIIPTRYDSIIAYLNLDEPYLIGDTLIDQPGSYDLIEIDEGPCPLYVNLQLLELLEEEVFVFVPNAFTPDGDGYNEHFSPVISNDSDHELVEFHFMIFDRDGHVVYESSDYETCRWNGQNPYTTDFYAQDAVYNWVLTYRMTGSSAKEKLRGMVVLLR